MRRRGIMLLVIFAGALSLLPAARGPAGLIEFTDRDEWLKGVGEFTRIDFTGFPDGTLLDDQFADLGVLFPDQDDHIFVSGVFRNDGVGARGGHINDEIQLTFAQPIQWLGTDFLEGVEYEVFRDGELVGASRKFNDIESVFSGIFSDLPFNAAIIRDPGGGTNIDDLYFQQIVPLPSALVAAAGLACVLGLRGRRRQRA